MNNDDSWLLSTFSQIGERYNPLYFHEKKCLNKNKEPDHVDRFKQHLAEDKPPGMTGDE